MMYTRQINSDNSNPRVEGERPAVIFHELVEDVEASESREWWLAYFDLMVLIVVLCSIYISVQIYLHEEAQIRDDQAGPEIELLTVDSLSSVNAADQTPAQAKAELYRAWYDELQAWRQTNALGDVISFDYDEKLDLQLYFAAGVLFSDDRVSLSRSGRALLEMLYNQLADKPVRLVISGHNDPQETLAKEFSSKRELTEERALDVLDYFALKGIKDAHMAVIPYSDDLVKPRRRITIGIHTR